MAAVSQWEREAIGEQTHDALRHNLKAIRLAPGAPFPYGNLLLTCGWYFRVSDQLAYHRAEEKYQRANKRDIRRTIEQTAADVPKGSRVVLLGQVRTMDSAFFGAFGTTSIRPPCAWAQSSFCEML